MRIGILTYYRVANFGANLQAFSTYKYLEKTGHTPIFIHYMSRQLYQNTDCKYEENAQIKTHLDFVDKIIKNQTKLCFNSNDINNEIERMDIEAIIVGSDAVLQHHSFLERLTIKWPIIHASIKRPHFYIEKMGEERIFPNLFWGIGINDRVPKAMMSVSSQNSNYKLYMPWVKKQMKTSLERYKYISVRDGWTQKMLHSIGLKNIPITPDPVFAFNYNVRNLIPSYEEILNKYKLKKKYILISFLNVFLPYNVIEEIGSLFEKNGFQVVALTSQIGIRFKNNYSKQIDIPLNPLDWYALIKYSSGYIGNNMHPIIVALHNGVPFYSIDNYSNYDKKGRPIQDNSSKILDIIKRFGLEDNYIVPYGNNTKNIAQQITEKIISFPTEKVKLISQEMYNEYIHTMECILKHIER